MKVSEIFCSIQGEGKYIGVPSIFIRFSGCNLRCIWCDTPYSSWNEEFKRLSEDEIFLEISKFKNINHVVLTGGEPMMVKNIDSFCSKLKKMGKFITIETAGTLSPKNVKCDLVSLSPKLSNSNPKLGDFYYGKEVKSNSLVKNHADNRLNLEVLKEWAENYKNIQFKFVVKEKNDIHEILDITNKLNSLGQKIDTQDIFLMPEGISHKEILKKSHGILELCYKYRFRLAYRMHISLFGNCKGT